MAEEILKKAEFFPFLDFIYNNVDRKTLVILQKKYQSLGKSVPEEYQIQVCELCAVEKSVRECYACGKKLCSDCGHYCPKNYIYACNEHLNRCGFCGKNCVCLLCRIFVKNVCKKCYEKYDIYFSCGCTHESDPSKCAKCGCFT